MPTPAFKIIMVRQDRNIGKFHEVLGDLAEFHHVATVLVGSWAFAALVLEDEADPLAEIAQEEYGLSVKVIPANGGALMEKYFPYEFAAYQAAEAEAEEREWFTKTFTAKHTGPQLKEKRQAALAELNRRTGKDVILNVSLQTFTCDNCDTARLCPFAFDTYNISGDCLAVKEKGKN